MFLRRHDEKVRADERERIAGELEKRFAAYPQDIFGPISTDDSRTAHEALQEVDLTLDRFSANAMRHAYRQAIRIARGET